jgi:hypothetical protein
MRADYYLHSLDTQGAAEFLFNEPFTLVSALYPDPALAGTFQLVPASLDYLSDDDVFAVAPDGIHGLRFQSQLCRSGSSVYANGSRAAVRVTVATFQSTPPVLALPVDQITLANAPLYGAAGSWSQPVNYRKDGSYYAETLHNNSDDRPAPLAVGQLLSNVRANGWVV